MIYKRIIAWISCFVILFSMFPVAYADDEYISKNVTYWEQLMHVAVNYTSGIPGLSAAVRSIAGGLEGDVCQVSEDGFHYGDQLIAVGDQPDSSGRYMARSICKYCNKQFNCYASDLQQSYDAQVDNVRNEFGTTEFGSLGFIFPLPVVNYEVEGKAAVSDFSAGYVFSIIFTGTRGGSGNNVYLLTDSSLVAPVSGTYTLKSEFSGSNCRLYVSRYLSKEYLKGDSFEFYYNRPCLDIALSKDNKESSLVAMSGRFYFVVKPISYDVNNYTASIGGINSRPTSITGDYGIIGDNNQITKVEGDTIVNETNNTIYNPATGETHTLSDWSYNYTDRSYTATTSTGDTITVTYGDENVTIVEGDTIYNVYYLVDGSGSEEPGPEACAHDWAEDSTIPPTCSTPGKVSMTCSKCGQTKTEPIPATGHNWTVERTVQTSYDENGNLVQQGYTIYKCTVCGEQYKDSEGTGPPGTPGGSGGDGGKSIWEKIGEFFGTIGGGFIDMIGAVAGKLLDALTKLAEMLMDKLKTVVETVLSIFDEVPALFGGFLDFLGAIFPFLPPEITTILTFGVIAITFIGILKAVRR